MRPLTRNSPSPPDAAEVRARRCALGHCLESDGPIRGELAGQRAVWMCYNDNGVGQASAVAAGRSRKVRAPQGRALGNTQAGRPDGKWHRNTPPFVAKAMKGKGEMVR
jgi:hypothetical protein